MPKNTSSKVIVGHQLQANNPAVCRVKTSQEGYNQGSKKWLKPHVGILQNGKFVRVPVK